MKFVTWGLLILLVVAHQDFWLWNDRTLLGGWMPIGLMYHVCLSLAAAAAWWLATVYCWPIDEPGESAASETRSVEAAEESR